MAGIKRSSAEWMELVKQQRISGLTMKTWCEQNSVNLYTMADRVSRFRKEGVITDPKPNRGGKPKKQTQWVEARAAERSKGISLSLPALDISIKVGEFSIIVPPNFDETALIRVCKALVSLGCW